uniref:Reverse transcriptase domain-containing protein n=1 Tax=Salvator merianae TaxID=96440 RepID=A0A8D0KKR5_SALMN
MKDNIGTIIDVIEYLETHNEVQAVLFLDVEKAFDNLHWNFMFDVLDRMNFEENFMKWIRAIPSTQSAQLTIRICNRKRYKTRMSTFTTFIHIGNRGNEQINKARE